GERRDAQRQPGRRQQRLVVEEGLIPLQREARPYRHERRLVEGIHHQADDGDVEEGEAQDQHQPVQQTVVTHHRCSSWRTWLCWNRASGTSSSSTMTQVTAAAMGQSVLLKNSVHMTRPIMRVLAPPSSSGM